MGFCFKEMYRIVVRVWQLVLAIREWRDRRGSEMKHENEDTIVKLASLLL
jgi:hypothetical protein